MDILVGLKHVPDTETKIKVAADGRSIDEAGVKWIISPYDEYAIEQALRIREARGTGEVVVVSAGRDAARDTLRQGLALGADRAVLILDGRLERCDGFARAQVLAGLVRTGSYDLVLLGKYGVGTDAWHTAPMLAELLGWPHAGAVCKLEVTATGFTAAREIEGAVEIVEGSLPAVISCDKGLNEPRYASLKGIMQAKKKTVDTRTPADLGLDPADLDRPCIVWESIELPPARSKVVMLEGPAHETARRLAQLLRDTAKVI